MTQLIDPNDIHSATDAYSFFPKKPSLNIEIIDNGLLS